MKTRRQFLKDTCVACTGGTLMSWALSSCATLPVYKTSLTTKSVDVPVSQFLESSMVIVRDMQTPYDILLIKKSDTDYNAIYMKCSHRENPVSATKTGLYCSEHGSTFDLDGNVTKEPAPGPLKRFRTEIKSDVVVIDLNY